MANRRLEYNWARRGPEQTEAVPAHRCGGPSADAWSWADWPCGGWASRVSRVTVTLGADPFKKQLQEVWCAEFLMMEPGGAGRILHGTLGALVWLTRWRPSPGA
ncbi:hypothetical protein NDU88_002093 [Pleurodeles waltl]|uniref:Uncharacterized protein n=1 Tax=Pleurodeles waltl TaxID=8319 RepID=A0AAV7S9A1_PLEWA|nr:hypothetical protein NDU88_002093 [Pleurodeles waltl]